MKKKIAFIFTRMAVGGAEKALLEMLKAIDVEKYDVALLTLNDKGAYFDELPQGIRPIYLHHENSSQQLIEDLKHLRLFRFARGCILRVRIRLCRDSYGKFALSMLAAPKVEEEFDCAIAYKLGYEDTAVLLSRVNAKKKAAWVHSSISEDKGTRKLYRSIDPISKIYCVSQQAKKDMDEKYPHLAHKTQVFYNLIDVQRIQQDAQVPVDMPMTGATLVTVGRLSAVKGQNMVPKAVRLLLDRGHNVRWYLVGDGPLRQTVEQEIEKYQVQNHVALLGTKNNPYPYICNCDIYVQTSFSECYCTTTMEAKVLGKPIVTTDAPGMQEQFVSGENGLIVDAMTPEALAEGVATLLEHPELREKFVSALEKESFDNKVELQKLYDFIEN